MPTTTHLFPPRFFFLDKIINKCGRRYRRHAEWWHTMYTHVTHRNCKVEADRSGRTTFQTLPLMKRRKNREAKKFVTELFLFCSGILLSVWSSFSFQYMHPSQQSMVYSSICVDFVSELSLFEYLIPCTCSFLWLFVLSFPRRGTTMLSLQEALIIDQIMPTYKKKGLSSLSVFVEGFCLLSCFNSLWTMFKKKNGSSKHTRCASSSVK